MYYTIYKTTNLINGKIYVGKHQTHNLDDDYMGSGKHLRYSFAKYGIENFAKEILHVFDTEAEMNAKERELVTEEFCSRTDTYNICEGGHGGFGYINQGGLRSKWSTNTHIKVIETTRLRYGVDHFSKLENSKKSISIRIKNAWKDGKFKPNTSTFLGKKHTDQTKQIISQKSKERLKDPTQNSQYGTRWITNGKENKKIKKIDNIPEGYYSGRIIK